MVMAFINDKTYIQDNKFFHRNSHFVLDNHLCDSKGMTPNLAIYGSIV